MTGSNSTPLGDRRQPNEPLRLDVPTPPAGDRYHEQPTPTYLEPERGRYLDNYRGTVSTFGAFEGICRLILSSLHARRLINRPPLSIE